ncbi:succinate dehydrogenase cytochrome b subunit [Vulgatibacter sp.]|uniref:succinate dehydrogenase cytochrome b subunit n=1 Tax=Vulgatibacter sp. TaxID=1971226 RepID=UPI0035665B18
MNAAAAKTARPASPGSFLGRAITSSTGMKLVMAITGLGLLGFVIAHVIGNLQVFLGYEGINAYGAFLKGSPGLLWTLRLGTLALFVLHIWAGVRLSRLNHAARPHAYVKKKYRAASWYSRYMLVSGTIVLVFLVFHLLHFTVGTVFPDHFALRDPSGRHDVFAMMLEGFAIPWVVVFYVVAMVLLFFHLGHGIWSATQSLGIWGGRWTPAMMKVGLALAVILAIAYSIIPLGLFAGLVPDYRSEKAASEQQLQQQQN